MRIYDHRTEEVLTDSWVMDIMKDPTKTTFWLASGYHVTLDSSELKQLCEAKEAQDG